MKLQVPSPNEPTPRDHTQLSDELWIGMVLSVMIIFFGWFFWIQPQYEAEEDPYAHIEDVEEREMMRDRAEFEELVDSGRINRVDWVEDEERALRIFDLGPRAASEVVCEDYAESIRDGVVPRRISLALLQAVSRRSSSIPWTCLVRLYLEEQMPEGRELTEEFDRLWREIETVNEHGPAMKIVIDDFRRKGSAPDSERFHRWLRRCAMAVTYDAVDSCQRMLADMAPAYGEDLLEMVIYHLEQRDLSKIDIHLAADALAYFAKYGQPASWFTVETETLPDYDVDFRLGSAFKLCRLMYAPDEEIHEYAARALGDVAGYAVGPTARHVRYRWRRSCRLAFGDPENPQATVPLLRVVIAGNDTEESVDYGLQRFFADGRCTEEESMPVWFCGADRWNGGSRPVGDVLGDFFAVSAHADWYDLDYLED